MARDKATTVSETAHEKSSIQDDLDFIARTRRQLDTIDKETPHAESNTAAHEAAATVRGICNELEADLRRQLPPGK